MTKRPNGLVFFAICGMVDFIFGLVREHSVLAGVVFIICGLPLTAFFISFSELIAVATIPAAKADVRPTGRVALVIKAGSSPTLCAGSE